MIFSRIYYWQLEYLGLWPNLLIKNLLYIDTFYLWIIPEITNNKIKLIFTAVFITRFEDFLEPNRNF